MTDQERFDVARELRGLRRKLEAERNCGKPRQSKIDEWMAQYREIEARTGVTLTPSWDQRRGETQGL